MVFLEKDFENILAKYPSLIEKGLTLEGRQVTIYGRRMDLLFKDTLGRQLIVELKAGPIKDEHIGQIMSYEGSILSDSNPDVRIMLVGTRVPPNIRKSLDHHGIAWKEISFTALSKYLQEIGNGESLCEDEDIKETEEASCRVRGSISTPAKERNLAFWKGFFEKTRGRTVLFHDYHHRGGDKPTIYVRTLMPHMTYSIRVAAHHTLVYVHIDSADATSNRKRFDYFLGLRKIEIVEQEFGGILIWDPKPEKKICQIYKKLGLGLNDTDKRDELYEQMIETMIRLEKAFCSVIGSMPV